MALPPREEPASIGGFVVVQFLDEKYAGYEVKLRRNVPLAEALTLQQATNGADPEGMEYAYRMIGAGLIESWNLMRRVIGPDGQPVRGEDGEPLLEPLPIDAEALLRQPGDFARPIYDCFVNEVLGLNPTLPPPSSDGDGSAAEPTPLPVRRSASRRSSREQS